MRLANEVIGSLAQSKPNDATYQPKDLGLAYFGRNLDPLDVCQFISSYQGTARHPGMTALAI
jgi:hypothetical protein